MIRGLPYDAELEYLECAGTSSAFPYINTGIVGDSNTTYEAMLRRNTQSTNECAIGSWNSGDTRCWIAYYFGNKFYLGMGRRVNDGGTPQPNVWYKQTLKAESSNFNLYVDDVLTATVPQTTFTSSQPLYIGAMNSSGTASYYFSGRFGSVKIYQNGVLVLDLIPVRVGSGASAVGYMYDRVSRKLFGNAGTGAFVLGPDKAVPILSLHRYASPSNGVALGKMGCTDLFHRITAKDYVQSGLVAMWDAIENVGYGQHNSSATTWKDLVGSNDVTYTGTLSQSTGYWDDQCFRAVAKGDYSFRRAISQEWLAALDGPITIDGVFTISDSGLNNSALLQIAKASENNDGIMFSVYNSFSIAASVKGAWGAENRSSIQVGTDYSYSGRKIYCAMIADATQVKEILYLGGIKMEGASQARSAILSGTDTLSIGTYAVSAFKTRTAIGEYNRFNIYSRALTADEIARNYAIDKARFGLP